MQFDESVTELCPETNRNLRKFLQAARIENMLLNDGRRITDPGVWNDISKEMLIPSINDDNGQTISLTEACLSGDEDAVKLFLSSKECNVNEIGIDGDTLLACAVSKNAVPLVELLLQRGVDPNLKEKKLESIPLVEAAKDGHTDVVRLLLQYGASVSQTSNTGYTALHYAATNGYLDCVKLLLQYKSPLEVQNENGYTPLMEASSNGHIDVARCLIEHGADINTHSTEFKESALTLASYKGHAEMVKFLLDAGAYHEHRTDEMHTALMEAAMEGHVEVAKLLLTHGANVNIPQDSFESPLTLAACGGHTELAHLLIGYEADIEEVNDEGYTPLMEAAREGHEETVALLLAAGADVNAKTEETQETALTLAAGQGFVEVCDMLLNAGADIEVGSVGCSTPLMEAAQEGHLELVRRLIQRGANVNAITATGDTALHYAAENGHVKVCRELLSCRASVDTMIEGCKSPLMKAARTGHLEVVQLFVEWGLPVNQSTSRNDATALSLACNGGHHKVVEYLLNHGADPQHQLSDGCTMLIEAARSGSPVVLRLILDFPKSLSQPIEVPVLPPNGPAMSAQQLQNSSSMAAIGIMPPSLPVGSQNGILNSLIPPNSIHTGVLPFATPVSTVRHALSAQQNPTRLKTALANAYAVGWAAGAAAFAQHPQQQPPQPSVVPNEAYSGAQAAPMLSSSGAQSTAFACGTKSQNIQQQQKILRLFNKTDASPATAAGDSAANVKTGVANFPLTSSLSSNTIGEVLNMSLVDQQQTASSSSPVCTDELSAGILALFQELMPNSKTDKTDLLQRFEAMMYPRSSQSSVPTSTTTQTSHLQNTGTCPSFETSALRHIVKQQKLQQVISGAAGDSTAVIEFPQAADVLFPPITEPTVHWDAFSAPGGASFPECAAGRIDYSNASEVALSSMADAVSVLEHQENKASGEGQFSAVGSGSSSSSSSTGGCASSSSSSASSTFSISTQLIDASAPYNYSSRTGQAGKPEYSALSEFYVARLASGGTVQQPISSEELFNQEALATYRQCQVTSRVTCPFEVACSLAQAIASSTCQQQQLQQQRTSTLVSMKSVHTTTSGSFTAADRNALNLLLTQPVAGSMPSPTVYDHLLTQSEVIQQPAQQRPGDASGTFPLALFSANGKTTNMVPVVKATTTSVGSVVTATTLTCPSEAHAVSSSPATVTSSTIANVNPMASTMGEGASATVAGAPPPPPPPPPQVDINACIESSMESALTLACNGGFVDLARLLLERGADKEHRDKKSYTPLHSAVYANQRHIVSLLLDYGADIEAQVERTKDTALSIACSHGRIEIAEELLKRGANKEHRNFSDYTPLSLAASGGFIDVIQLLLSHGAEINSRTGSKLGISPLMLASMNGFTVAVRVLLEHGSDINAQIETNRNTALTLACFQGQHEVVQLLVERKANIEHRAKTGLTPLMEAASGNHVKVGKILIDNGADVNALPVLSSRDTALTIAADKGRTDFVNLLLEKNSVVEARNKKGATSLWLACNGGHLEVVQSLINAGADVNSQDNRKVSCLMAAFRKGHVSVVNVLVQHVTQFPSDKDCLRHIKSISNDKDVTDRCQQCRKIIAAAKEKQEGEARKNADFLLEQIEQEEEERANKEAMQARKRERKRNKRKAKLEKERKDKEGGLDEPAVIIEPEDIVTPLSVQTSLDIEQGNGIKETNYHENSARCTTNLMRSVAQSITIDVQLSTVSCGASELFPLSKSDSSKNESDAPEMPESQSSKRSRKEAASVVHGKTQTISSPSTDWEPSDTLATTTALTNSPSEASVTEAKREKHRNKKQSQRAHKRSETAAAAVAAAAAAIAPRTTTFYEKLSSPTVPTALTAASTNESVSKVTDASFYGEMTVSCATTDEDTKVWNSVFDSPPSHDDAAGNDSSSWFVVQPASSNRSHKSVNNASSLGTGTSATADSTDWKTTSSGNLSKRKLAIPVSKHDIGKIIGQGGAVVSALRNMSGIQIDIESARGEEVTERMVYLKGSSEIVQRTYDIIQDLLSGVVAGNDVIAKYAASKKTTTQPTTVVASSRSGKGSARRIVTAVGGTKTTNSVSTTSTRPSVLQPLVTKITGSSGVVPLCGSLKTGPNTNNNNTNAGVLLTSSVGCGKLLTSTSWGVKQSATNQKGNFAAVAAAGVLTSGGSSNAASQKEPIAVIKTKNKGNVSAVTSVLSTSMSTLAFTSPAQLPVSPGGKTMTSRVVDSTLSNLTPLDSVAHLDDQSFPPLSTSVLSKLPLSTGADVANIQSTQRENVNVSEIAFSHHNSAPFTSVPSVPVSACCLMPNDLEAERIRFSRNMLSTVASTTSVGSTTGASPSFQPSTTVDTQMHTFAKPVMTLPNTAPLGMLTPVITASRPFARAPGSERSAQRNATAISVTSAAIASTALADSGGSVVTPTKRVALQPSSGMYPGTAPHSVAFSANTTWQSSQTSVPGYTTNAKNGVFFSETSHLNSVVPKNDSDESPGLARFASTTNSNLDSLFSQQQQQLSCGSQFLGQSSLSSNNMWSGAQTPVGELNHGLSAFPHQQQQPSSSFDYASESMLAKNLYPGSPALGNHSTAHSYMILQNNVVGRGVSGHDVSAIAPDNELFPSHMQSSYRLASQNAAVAAAAAAVVANKVNGAEVLPPSCGSSLSGYSLPSRSISHQSGSTGGFQPRSTHSAAVAAVADYAAAIFNGGTANSAFHPMSPPLHSSQLAQSRLQLQQQQQHHHQGQQQHSHGGMTHQLAHMVSPSQLPQGGHLQHAKPQPSLNSNSAYLHQQFATPGLGLPPTDHQSYLNHLYQGGGHGGYPSGPTAVHSVGSPHSSQAQQPVPIGAERRRQVVSGTASGASGPPPPQPSLNGASVGAPQQHQPQPTPNSAAATYGGRSQMNPNSGAAVSTPMLMALTMNLMQQQQQQMQSQDQGQSVSGNQNGVHSNWSLHHPALWSQNVGGGLANQSSSNQAHQQSMLANAAAAVAALAHTGLWPPATGGPTNRASTPCSGGTGAGSSGSWLVPPSSVAGVHGGQFASNARSNAANSVAGGSMMAINQVATTGKSQAGSNGAPVCGSSGNSAGTGSAGSGNILEE